MNEQLKALQNLCAIARGIFGTSNLIVAGGAPRDVLSGVPVKDIDIFVQVTPEDLGQDEFDAFTETVTMPSGFQKACNELARTQLGMATFEHGPEGYGELADLCSIEIEGSTPIQVIALFEDPVNDVHNYDFTISQVFVTPNGLFQTQAAYDDRLRRMIRYTGHNGRSDAAIERSRKRLARLRAKYPDWMYVDCYGLDIVPTEGDDLLGTGAGE